MKPILSFFHKNRPKVIFFSQICTNKCVIIMYTIRKRIEISAAHSLKTTYESQCNKLHGHNWIITISCRSKELNENGMVEDFTAIKSMLHRTLDHTYLNDVLPFNPTAENIAKWICDQIPTAFRVEVTESENNTAIYEED